MDQNHQAELKEKAAKIHAYLRSSLRHSRTEIPRPFFLEFTGTPSSGKTTLIKEADKFLRRQGFRVWMPQEGAEVIRHITRDTPLYNLRTALYALSILIDESVGNKYDVVIFDRCLFDGYCWMEYWFEKGKLSEAERLCYQQFFLSPFFSKSIDAAFFVTCSPEEAVRRELRIAVTNELGETTNPKSVAGLIARYAKTYEILKPSFPDLRMIDTTYLDEKKMVEIITSSILDVLLAKIQSRP